MVFVQNEADIYKKCTAFLHHTSHMPLFRISTLGPCAEAMGLSVMMVFCIGVAQLPIMIGLAMHLPSVRVDMYSSYVQVQMDPSTNQSAAVIPTPVSFKHVVGGGGEGAGSSALVMMQA